MSNDELTLAHIGGSDDDEKPECHQKYVKSKNTKDYVRGRFLKGEPFRHAGIEVTISDCQ